MHLRKLAAVVAAMLPSAAFSQDAEAVLPNPATIAVPNLAGSDAPAVVANGWKYFLYHRPDTSFAEAYADIADCYRHLTPAGWGNVMLPRFVPWVERSPGQRYNTNNQAGLVGLAIGGMIEGTLVRRDRQSKMRRCMEPRGYVRYGVAEEIWERIADMPPPEGIAMQAKIASGALWGGKVPVK